MSLSESDKVVFESIRQLADAIVLLDGKHGDGGGVLTRTGRPWRITSSFIFRAYIFDSWLENKPPLPSGVSNDILAAYNRLIDSAERYVRKMPDYAKALSADVSLGIRSWETDSDVWQCGLWLAAASAGAFVTVESLSPEALLFTVGATAEAIDKCSAIGDDDRDRGGHGDKR